MIPSVLLSTDYKMPLLGLGTWRLTGKECEEAVKLALSLGYRHIDTAHMYMNHKAIGKAIKGCKRSDLFITSKLAWDEVNDNNVEESVEKACDHALKELGIDYLDLYLMHWPDRTRPMQKALLAMQALREKKKVRSMGVSNFTIRHLQDALDAGMEIAVNQVEFHPYLYQKKLLDFCHKHKIHLTSYRSLGKGEILSEPLFKKIGERHDKSPAQIVLRWLVQLGISVIPMSTSKKHQMENLGIFSFSLTEQEMEALNHLDKGHRYCDPDWEEFSYTEEA